MKDNLTDVHVPSTGSLTVSEENQTPRYPKKPFWQENILTAESNHYFEEYSCLLFKVGKE